MLITNSLKSKTTKTDKLITILIVSIIGIEINYGFKGINVGNLVVCIGAIVVIFSSITYRKSSYIFGMFFMTEFFYALILGMGYLISSTWSSSAIDTIVQSFFFFTILISCYLLRDAVLTTVIRSILLSGFWVAMLSLVALLIDTGYALQPFQSTAMPELKGIFKHQQRLGLFMCIILGITVIAIINREKDIFIGRILKYKKTYLIFITFIALFAFARLNMAFAVLALVLSYLITISKFTKFFTITFLFFLCIYLYEIDILAYFVNSYEKGEISLTGRFLIWDRTVEQALNRPLLGFGYGVFNSPKFDFMWSDSYRPPHAHNSFIQSFFDGGWVGLTLLCCLVYQHVKISSKVVKGNKQISYSAFICLLAVISSFTGVTYGGKPSILYSITFLFIAITPYRKIKHVRVS